MAAAAATILFCFLFVVLLEGIVFGGGDGADNSILIQISLAILALCGVIAACTTFIVEEIRHSKDENTNAIQKIQKRD